MHPSQLLSYNTHALIFVTRLYSYFIIFRYSLIRKPARNIPKTSGVLNEKIQFPFETRSEYR